MSSQVAKETALGYVFASISSRHMSFQNSVVVPQTTLTLVIPLKIGVSLSMPRHQNDPSELEACGIFLIIERVPGQLNPRDILLVIEFVQKFEKQGVVLDTQVENSKASFIFGLAYHVPSSQGITFVPLVSFLDP